MLELKNLNVFVTKDFMVHDVIRTRQKHVQLILVLTKIHYIAPTLEEVQNTNALVRKDLVENVVNISVL